MAETDENPFAALAGIGSKLQRAPAPAPTVDADADASAEGDLLADPMQELRALSEQATTAETLEALRQIVSDIALRSAEAYELLDDDTLEEYVEPETMRPIYDLLQVAGLMIQLLGQNNGAPARAAEAQMAGAAKQQWGAIMQALPAIVEQSNLKLSYLAEQSHRMRGDDEPGEPDGDEQDQQPS